MDKLVRRLTDKLTGAALTLRTVVARPVGAADSSTDQAMSETPANSGIYATATEIPHDTYKILVNGVDTLDEVTVEPGRVKVRDASGSSPYYPTIDSVLDAKLSLKGTLADGTTTANAAQFRTAILTAAADDVNKRCLILDQDVTLATATTVSHDLHIDLNGYTFTLSANLISTTNRIAVRNGTINVPASEPIIQGATTLHQNILFTGAGLSSYCVANAASDYIGCTGLVSISGADGAGQMANVVGGQHGFGNANQLKLTDPASKTGNGRLIALQSWIDSWLENSAAMAILTWLVGGSVKTELAKWVALPAATKTYLASYFGAGGQTVNATFAASFPTPSVVVKYGVKCGIAITGNVNGARPNLKGCISVTGSGGMTLVFSVPYSALAVNKASILQFDDTAANGGWNAWFRCRQYNTSTGILTDNAAGGSPTGVQITDDGANINFIFPGILVPSGAFVYDFEMTLPQSNADLFSY